MQPILEAAAIGAVFLLALVAPAYADNPSLLSTSADKDPLFVLVGAAGIGAAISLITPAALEMFVWAGRRLRNSGPPVPSTRLANALDGFTRLDGAYLARTYMAQVEAPDTLTSWLVQVRQQAQSMLNGGLALLIGSALANTTDPALTTRPNARVVLGIMVVVGLVALANGLRRHRDARRVEDLWLVVGMPHRDHRSAAEARVPARASNPIAGITDADGISPNSETAPES